MPIPHLSHPKYRPDIDGLRAVAVTSVVAFHAFPAWMPGGFIGVDVFFVISGFLISTIMFENLDRGTFSFSGFYSRRIRRIFPALLIVLGASYTFGWFALLADEYKQLGKHIAAGAGFVSNIVFWGEAGYFDNSAETKPLLHLWSLGIEEQFYIAWPIAIWLAWKVRFNLLTLTIVVTIASLYFNLRDIRTDAVATFYSPQTRFWELSCGSILAWFVLYKEDALNKYKSKVHGWLDKVIYRRTGQTDSEISSTVISLAGCLLLTFGFWRITKDVSFPGKWAVIPVLGSALVITAGPNAWINRRILSNRIAVWFGLISFPLYLWHWPLLSFAWIAESGAPSRNIRVGAVVISVILAWVTYRLVERPIRFGRHSKKNVAVLMVLMAIMGYVGYYTYINDGLEFRGTISNYVNNKNELIRTPAIDRECLKYTELNTPLFDYCRYTNANSIETVAVIGDSHAHVAYPGIAEYLRKQRISTVLLANSSCPPFMGIYTGRNQAEKNACRDKIQQLLDAVINRSDISRVFVFTRGPTYNTGTEPLTGNRDLTNGEIIPLNQFANAAQLTFDRLSQSGKVVFYVTENPELNYSADACLGRPFKSEVKNCSVRIEEVLKRQIDYINAFKSLQNVTVIDSLSTFCPQQNCIVFDEDGSLLYADDDHLSIAGSRFQADKLLKNFLH